MFVSLRSTSEVESGRSVNFCGFLTMTSVRGLDLPRAETSASNNDDEIYQAAHDIGDSFRQADRLIYPVSSLRPSVSQEERQAWRTSSPDMDARGGIDADVAAPLDQAQYTANPLTFISGADRPFSLRSLLHPTSGPREIENAAAGEPVSGSDLVGRGVLTLDMAKSLFGL